MKFGSYMKSRRHTSLNHAPTFVAAPGAHAAGPRWQCAASFRGCSFRAASGF